MLLKPKLLPTPPLQGSNLLEQEEKEVIFNSCYKYTLTSRLSMEDA